jgi:hypothetical protein
VISFSLASSYVIITLAKVVIEDIPLSYFFVLI